MEKKATWREFANYMIREGYNTIVTFESEEDGTDNCVYCPECGEPILEDDFEMINKTKEGYFICPICEYRL